MNKEQSASFKYWQTRTIISTIIIYATFYLVRKNLSMAMPDLQADLGITKAQLGLFLTLHGAIYGISKFLSGFAADRLSSRHMLYCHQGCERNTRYGNSYIYLRNRSLGIF